MYVRNVAGYNFAFRYRDSVIHVPYDGKIYSIPDDSGTYRELKVILPMNVRTQPVTYINKDGSTASPNLSGHKRRGRPPKKENDSAPVADKKEETENITELDINDVNVSIVNIDVDKELKVNEEVKVEENIEEPPKKKRGRPKKTKTSSAKTTSTKKRGRPKKSTK